MGCGCGTLGENIFCVAAEYDETNSRTWKSYTSELGELECEEGAKDGGYTIFGNRGLPENQSFTMGTTFALSVWDGIPLRSIL